MGKTQPPESPGFISGEEGSHLPLCIERVIYAVPGKHLLGEISAVVNSPVTFVVGPNGAGKSLFLRLVHGLLEPTSGSIAWGAERLTPVSARHNQAMVFQKPVLLRRSARANVEYALAVKGINGVARRDRLEEVLHTTGLWELRHQPARVLSGGEQQRLVLARAWAFGPSVLLLDEPTANLDPSATRQLEDLIRKIRAGGAAIIMTSHDLGQVNRLAEEVLFLHQGKILEQTAAKNFIEHPKTNEGRAFISGELLW